MCSVIWLTITKETASALCNSESEFYSEAESKMLGQISRLSFPLQNGGKTLYRTHAANSIQGTAHTFVQLQSFRLLSVWTLTNPRAFKPDWKWRDVLQMHFVCLSKHSQLLLDLWECATCPDKLVPCVHRFKRKISGAFVMNCDLLDNKNTTAVKFGTCVSNLLCQSQIECHIVKLFIV